MDLKIIPGSEQKDKICVMVGTRPGIIKMSPIIKELERRGVRHFVIHAGQHYSYNMDRKFFEDIGLMDPKYRLENVKRCKLHGEQTAEMIKGIEKILIKEKPKIVLVCADANFNLAGALAARKLRLKVGHVEAGLRSNDWLMPEEHNRVMIDHISDFLFVPTEEAKENAIKDNVKGKIVLTGNTIVDAVKEHLKTARKKSMILEKLKLKPHSYFVLTLHREENVDSKKNLKGIIDGLSLVGKKFKTPIIFPLHPRTKKRIKQFNLEKCVRDNKWLIVIEPIGYIDFLVLLSNSRVAISDSGGVQEETCILGVPCVTLRGNTERPETLEVGSNVLAGTEPERIVSAVKKMLNKKVSWSNPFGNGKAARKIVDTIT